MTQIHRSLSILGADITHSVEARSLEVRALIGAGDFPFSHPSRPDLGPLRWVRGHFAGGKVAGGRSQWPRGLRRGSTAAHLLGLWVRIPPRAWMSVSCEC
jgi:hypothetical protein